MSSTLSSGTAWTFCERRLTTPARRWLAFAREDLEFARYALDGGYFAHACFFSQQAAEKAVKAVHYAAGARSVLGHSVRMLIERLDPRVSTLDDLIESARELDLYYVPTRYPNGLDLGTPREAFSRTQAEKATGLTEALVTAAAEWISSNSPAGPTSLAGDG